MREPRRTALHAIMLALEQSTGIAGRLMRRRDDSETWMEVYENIADFAAFDARLGALLDAHRFAGWLAPGSTRKIELFVALKP